MKRIKKTMPFLLVVVMIISMSLTAFAADEVTLADIGAGKSDIVVFYTNDVHGGVSNRNMINGTGPNCLGYAGVAGIMGEAKDQAGAVLLVDVGDSIQGSAIDTDTKGLNSIKLMEELGYDICVPGNHEFDFGLDSFLDMIEASSLNYICCNFTDLDGNLVMPKAYDVLSFTIEGKDVKIGFVGVDTPESIAKGTPKYFQDDDGDFIYTFKEDPADLYQTVQDSIDACRDDGANYVVILGHLGDTGVENGWSSRDVIANTVGAGVFLDGHAHSIIPGEIVKNKIGEDVLLTSSGTKLDYLGVLKLSIADDGAISASSNLINTVTDEQKASDSYKNMDEKVKEVESAYDYLETVYGNSPFPLCIYNSETGDRMVRKQDTNMGDFLTDGYLWYANNDPNLEGFQKADVAFLNGGSIRANIAAGDIQYGHILAVMPWATRVTQIKTTGQHILEALEMGARLLPDDECGGFIVASGLTYKIDPTKPSKVVTDDKGMFIEVDGTFAGGDFRVYDVKVGDKDIDPDATYILVINAYYSENMGDGMTMFKDDERIISSDDNVIDVDVICAYLEEGLGGKVPDKYSNENGDGRIVIEPQEGFPATGETSNYIWMGATLLLISATLSVAYIIERKKDVRC